MAFINNCSYYLICCYWLYAFLFSSSASRNISLKLSLVRCLFDWSVSSKSSLEQGFLFSRTGPLAFLGHSSNVFAKGIAGLKLSRCLFCSGKLKDDHCSSVIKEAVNSSVLLRELSLFKRAFSLWKIFQMSFLYNIKLILRNLIDSLVSVARDCKDCFYSHLTGC